MTILYQENLAVFQDIIGVDEADSLLEWLMKGAKKQVDFSDCRHLHAAGLQTLMAAKPTIVAWPKDATLSVWLKAALNY